MSLLMKAIIQKDASPALKKQMFPNRDLLSDQIVAIVRVSTLSSICQSKESATLVVFVSEYLIDCFIYWIARHFFLASAVDKDVRLASQYCTCLSISPTVCLYLFFIFSNHIVVNIQFWLHTRAETSATADSNKPSM